MQYLGRYEYCSSSIKYVLRQYNIFQGSQYALTFLIYLHIYVQSNYNEHYYTYYVHACFNTEFLLFLGHKRMWTSTNYFLVNLSITDLLLTVLNGLFNFIYMRDNNWIFGDIYCTINNFVAYVTVAASVLTLTAITLDRQEYNAIVMCDTKGSFFLRFEVRT